MKHKLTIKPAIDPKYRHEIENTLKDMGYNITGGGAYTNGSECDISFEGNPVKRKINAQARKVRWNQMKLTAILAIVSMAYRTILRDLLKNAIDDPNQEWDEMVLGMLDALFGYKE